MYQRCSGVYSSKAEPTFQFIQYVCIQIVDVMKMRTITHTLNQTKMKRPKLCDITVTTLQRFQFEFTHKNEKSRLIRLLLDIQNNLFSSIAHLTKYSDFLHFFLYSLQCYNIKHVQFQVKFSCLKHRIQNYTFKTSLRILMNKNGHIMDSNVTRRILLSFYRLISQTINHSCFITN